MVKLRGLLYRKVKAHQQSKKLTPAMQKVYDTTYKGEVKKLAKAETKQNIDALKNRAKKDAIRAATPRSTRLATGFRAIGREAGKGAVSGAKKFAKSVDKMDTEKFEKYVTGVSTSKRKK